MLMSLAYHFLDAFPQILPVTFFTMLRTLPKRLSLANVGHIDGSKINFHRPNFQTCDPALPHHRFAVVDHVSSPHWLEGEISPLPASHSAFCLSHDTWGNGQLVASVFLHLFLPLLFCVVLTQLVLIPYLVTYYAAGIRSYEIWGCHAIACDDFSRCLFYLWSLPVTPNYILSFLSICPIHKDYIAIHFGCLQSLLALLFLSFWAWILCFLMLYLLLFWPS